MSIKKRDMWAEPHTPIVWSINFLNIMIEYLVVTKSFVKWLSEKEKNVSRSPMPIKISHPTIYHERLAAHFIFLNIHVLVIKMFSQLQLVFHDFRAELTKKCKLLHFAGENCFKPSLLLHRH